MVYSRINFSRFYLATLILNSFLEPIFHLTLWRSQQFEQWKTTTPTSTQPRVNRIHRNNQPEQTTIKQHRQNGWKKVNTKFRFYRIEKRISPKSTQRCGGNKFRKTPI